MKVITAKLIRLTRPTMEGSCAIVLTNKGVTKEVEIKTEVRQGDALSTTLFNIVLDGVISASGIKRSVIINSLVQAIAYADDIALIARSRKSLEEAFLAVVTKAKIRGLEINHSKTKYMTSSRAQKSITRISLRPYRFDQVEHFKYLGVMVNGSNDRSMEINERIQAGNRAYWSYQRFLKDKSISKTTKLQIYKTTIRPVVTYSSETMCLSQRDEDKLRVFERKVLRKILGPKRNEEGQYRILWNYEIVKILEGEDIIKYVKAQRLRWFGHIERRDEAALIRKIKDWKRIEDRPKGRPKARWEEQKGVEQNCGHDKKDQLLKKELVIKRSNSLQINGLRSLVEAALFRWNV
ncbi:reverse transcriptase (rna-dependent dna polymerase) [Holotrichia oblita]|uniref:Reverse transcriptase (Rna-dependent dna polymerase) n=1 Tax=Holotrichia oblita TaxID=644536 RepID=A0ACB9SZ02_HOLOL|nr:reverse transcriptase (rna-dependent dna polymerase) [Holotrichia oblita]